MKHWSPSSGEIAECNLQSSLCIYSARFLTHVWSSRRRSLHRHETSHRKVLRTVRGSNLGPSSCNAGVLTTLWHCCHVAMDHGGERSCLGTFCGDSQPTFLFDTKCEFLSIPMLLYALIVIFRKLLTTLMKNTLVTYWFWEWGKHWGQWWHLQLGLCTVLSPADRYPSSSEETSERLTNIKKKGKLLCPDICFT